MNCLLCAGKTKLYFDYGKQTSVLQRLVRCVDCGLVQTDPMPAESFLREWYQRYDVLGEREPYYQALADTDPWNTPEGFEIAMQFGLVKRTLIKHLQPNILDIGSGPGLFLDLVKRAGWQEVGIELNAEAAVNSRERFGVDARAGTIASVEFASDSFDAITLWDIFEHVRDPLDLLKRSHDLLKPGGYLFIETPNVRSVLDGAVLLLAKIGLKVPAATFYGLHHLTLWNAETIERALKERGFAVRKIRYGRTHPARIFRGGGARDFVMRMGVTLIQAVGKFVGRENKMIVIAQKS